MRCRWITVVTLCRLRLTNTGNACQYTILIEIKTYQFNGEMVQ
ncbi:Uncharacterised protein [Vibrio cholerae]|nr:Uncharacterised protein [Vibrio cholerae]